MAGSDQVLLFGVIWIAVLSLFAIALMADLIFGSIKERWQKRKVFNHGCELGHRHWWRWSAHLCDKLLGGDPTRW